MTTGLTGIIDNAAITYLGGQTTSLTPSLKYALMAGAVSGGGLTIIANAPNPIGYSLLMPDFQTGVSPLKLLGFALVPTGVAMAAFWWL